MDFSSFYSSIKVFEGSWGWIGQVFIVVFVSLLLDFLQKRVLRKIHDRLTRTHTVWDDALFAAAQRPISLLIWVLGITFAAQIIQLETEAAIFAAADAVRDVGVIFALTWFGLRFVKNAEKNIIAHRLSDTSRIDKPTAEAIGKLLRISLAITATLITLQTLGFSVSGIMAFGGIGGIAVGFAAKDLLANFFGGLMIYLDRPFSVGDWIRSPDKQIEGTVENIGWRLTTIRTFDKRPLYVPNAIFTSITVENPSRMTNRRIYETIGIRYDDAGAMESIVEKVKNMLSNHADIDTNQTLIVNFNAYNASSLDFFVYTFTKTTNWIEFHTIKQDVLLKIYKIIEDHGAEIAFPTSTIHLAGEENPAQATPANTI